MDAQTDPFAEETDFPMQPVVNEKGEHQTVIGRKTGKERAKQVLQENEKPLMAAEPSTSTPFFKDENPTTPVVAEQGALETYTRVGDLAPNPGFYKLDELDGIDLVIVGATKNKGDFGDYLTLEFYFKNNADNPDPDRSCEGTPNVVNVGSTVAVPKVIRAIQMIQAKKAAGPLVAAFLKKPMSNGQEFWDVN